MANNDEFDETDEQDAKWLSNFMSKMQKKAQAAFGALTSVAEEKNDEELDDLREEIEDRQTRWFAFTNKLEERAKELFDEALPQLRALRKSDEDIYKSNYNKALSGVCGQLSAIRDKAFKAKDKEIVDFNYYAKDKIPSSHSLSKKLDKFWYDANEEFERFDMAIYELDKRLLEDAENDLEGEYQEIIDSFNAQKGNFKCSQCGATLQIERIFFIDVNVACGVCASQNSFEPSSQARRLQFIANDLAKKRCKPLLKAYEEEEQKERDLYQQAHELRLNAIHESARRKAEIEKERDRLNKLREEAIKNAPRLYSLYLRAVCDELNKILPEFKEHHEKMYIEQSGQIFQIKESE
ncbi:MAG: hypothetical protein LBP89_09585 [Helicobacteraceae bacterium]|jgi:hypothetical protein|nr:hypothetical protein [Helicobacteraceae bacterium]